MFESHGKIMSLYTKVKLSEPKLHQNVYKNKVFRTGLDVEPDAPPGHQSGPVNEPTKKQKNSIKVRPDPDRPGPETWSDRPVRF